MKPYIVRSGKYYRIYFPARHQLSVRKWWTYRAAEEWLEREDGC